MRNRVRICGRNENSSRKGHYQIQKMREKAVLSGDEYAVTVIDIQVGRIKAILEDNSKEAAFYTRKLWAMQEIGRPKGKRNKT